MMEECVCLYKYFYMFVLTILLDEFVKLFC